MSSEEEVNWGYYLTAAAEDYHGPAGHLAVLHGVGVNNHAANDNFIKVVEIQTGVNISRSLCTLPMENECTILCSAGPDHEDSASER